MKNGFLFFEKDERGKTFDDIYDIIKDINISSGAIQGNIEENSNKK